VHLPTRVSLEKVPRGEKWMTQYRREFIIWPRSYSRASDWDGVYLIVEEWDPAFLLGFL
jgi:hypothetical protein